MNYFVSSITLTQILHFWTWPQNDLWRSRSKMQLNFYGNPIQLSWQFYWELINSYYFRIADRSKMMPLVWIYSWIVILCFSKTSDFFIRKNWLALQKISFLAKRNETGIQFLRWFRLKISKFLKFVSFLTKKWVILIKCEISQRSWLVYFYHNISMFQLGQ